MADKKVEKAKKEKVTAKYTKDQLLKASKFITKRDLLEAVLKDEKTYTIAEAEKLLYEFLKGEVR